jgi:predicted transposase/invertase (TIGR01784 family)
MTIDYLDLKMDFMFKQLFGHPSRKSITIAFLNGLLNRNEDDRITDVQYENTELIKEEQDGKSSRLDVLVFTSSGERINIEIQMINQLDTPERLLYYWSRLFSSSLSSGQNYSELSPTIMISILNYPLFPQETDNFHTVFHLTEDKEHFLWSPHLEIHAIDLSQFMVKWKKYRREMKGNSPTELPWLMMLTAADYRKKGVNKEIFHELEEFSMNEQEIREAMFEWESLSSNKENKVLYEARMKFLRDQLSNLMGERRAGKEEGRKEGRQEGIKEGIALLVRKMAEKGIALKEIAKMTDLEEEEVMEMLGQK